MAQQESESQFDSHDDAILARFKALCDEVGIPHDPDVFQRHWYGQGLVTGAFQEYARNKESASE